MQGLLKVVQKPEEREGKAGEMKCHPEGWRWIKVQRQGEVSPGPKAC